MTYFHIYSSTMNGVSLEHACEEEAFRTWLCPGCNGPKPNCGAVDVRLQSPVRLDMPMTGIFGTFPGIASQELLSQIDPAIVRRDLFLGRVFRSNGAPIENWATFHGRYRLIVRGTKNIAERVCAECGRLVYFAAGRRHLYPEPPGDAAIYESDLAGLIFREEEFRKLDLSRWKKGYYLDKLPVGNFANES